MPADHGEGPVPLKIVIAGGRGVGRTTFVRSVSELAPFHTEETVTVAAAADTRAAPDESLTLDFGRISTGDSMVLHLFGTPAPDRFRFVWDELVRGAVGGLVLVDLRRAKDSFPAIDFLESRDVPFVVAVNAFPGADWFRPDDVRDALQLRADVPVVSTDARVRAAGLATIVRLVEHAAARSNVVRLPRRARFSR